MAAKKILKPSDYVHLHNHSQYSLLDGLTKIPPLVESVSKMGMTAVAITDHGTMSGVIEFYKASKAIKEFCQLSPECYAILRSAVASMNLTARSYHKVIKVARTIADLEGEKDITTNHIAEALQYRPQEEEF